MNIYAAMMNHQSDRILVTFDLELWP